VPHPVYSQDLASSDFFFFGYLKSKLQGIAVRSRPELISAIGEIFEEIPKKYSWLYGNPE
jgi:hypothetical protein